MAKLFLLKVWKPVVLATAAVGLAYGTKNWEKMSSPLHILNKNDDELAKLFATLDENNDGSIDETKLKHAFERAGVKVSGIRLKSMIYAADEDNDGKLSLEEFLHICHKIQHRDGFRSHPPPPIHPKQFHVPRETHFDDLPPLHKDIIPIIKPISTMPGQFPKSSPSASSSAAAASSSSATDSNNH